MRHDCYSPERLSPPVKRQQHPKYRISPLKTRTPGLFRGKRVSACNVCAISRPLASYPDVTRVKTTCHIPRPQAFARL